MARATEAVRQLRTLHRQLFDPFIEQLDMVIGRLRSELYLPGISVCDRGRVSYTQLSGAADEGSMQVLIHSYFPPHLAPNFYFY